MCVCVCISVNKPAATADMYTNDTFISQYYGNDQMFVMFSVAVDVLLFLACSHLISSLIVCSLCECVSRMYVIFFGFVAVVVCMCE